MKKMKRVFTMIIAITILSILVTGCNNNKAATDDKPVAVTFVVSGHGNSRGLNLETELISQKLSEVVRKYENGYITIINVDGDPDVVLSGNCDVPSQFKQGTTARLEEDSKERVASIMTKIRNIKADSPEVDTLKAIQLASRALSDVPKDTEKVIIIVDTGLSTTGLLNFNNNLLSGTDPNAIADALNEMHAIPDLTGVEIYWQQMGDVAAPQAELSPRQSDKLKSIWRAILEKGGGKLTILDALPVDAGNGDLPYVTPVKVDIEDPVAFSPSELKDDDFNFDEPVFLHEEQVQFVGDSDQYVNPDKAEETILPVSEYMLAHEDFKILLVGTTAGDGMSDYCVSLSERRAKAVKSTLVAQGVPDENIYVLGLGSSDPWHIYGAGTGTDKLASQNRKVVLLSADSKMGQELMK